MKKQAGITLVALVITIIILLILAGITIGTLNNVGLFNNARRAENAYKNAQNLENTRINDYDTLVNNYIEQLDAEE